MKRSLFALAVILYAIYGQDVRANDSQNLARAYSGTKMTFNENIQLYEGQKNVLIGDCKLKFPEASTGYSQIKKGTVLTIVSVEKSREGKSLSLPNGGTLKLNPYLRIRFSKLKTHLKCILPDSGKMTFQDLEYDGKVSLKSPEDIKSHVFK